jgi:predicted phage tail protein
MSEEKKKKSFLGLFEYDAPPDKSAEDVPVQTAAPVDNSSGSTSFTRRVLPRLGNNTDAAPVVTKPAQKTTVDQSDPIFQKFLGHFDSVLEKTNLPVPNYYSYSRMLAEMSDLPDQAKYRGSFAALKVQGLTKQTLIESANKFLGILDADAVGFKQTVQDSLKSNTDQIESINNQIQKNLDQIEKIKKDTADRIAKLQSDCDDQVQKLKDINETSQAQIDPLEHESQTVNDRVSIYQSAIAQYKDVIQDDINKIQSLIQ